MSNKAKKIKLISFDRKMNILNFQIEKNDEITSLELFSETIPSFLINTNENITNEVFFDKLNNANNTIEVSINPFSDEIMYQNLKINGEDVILASESYKIFQYKKGQVPLNIAGTHNILIKDVELAPIRKYLEGSSFIEKKFLGFKFFYEFEDKKAKDGVFYLAFSPSSEFNVTSEKVQKDTEKIAKIFKVVDKNNEVYSALLTLNKEVLEDKTLELKMHLQKNKENYINAVVESFFNNQNKLIITYQDVDKEKYLKIEMENSKELEKRVVTGMALTSSKGAVLKEDSFNPYGVIDDEDAWSDDEIPYPSEEAEEEL